MQNFWYNINSLVWVKGDKMMASNFLKHIGKIIRLKRTKAGITRKSLAKDMDISQATLSRYENGYIDIGATMMEKIGKHIGFPMKNYTDTYQDSEEESDSEK